MNDIPASRGRPPRGSERLSRDAIVLAALGEVGRLGPAGLSLRSVARHLNVDPKSLYHHVAGLDGLLDALADYVLSTFAPPARTGDAAADIRALAMAFRAHVLAHPRAATVVLTRPTRSPQSLAPTEAALAILHEAGLEDPDAVWLLRSVFAMLTGALLREAEAPSLGDDAALLGELNSHDLEAAGLHHVARSAGELSRLDHEAEYAHAVGYAIALIHSHANTP